ncbi:MAG: hypothetical protein QOE83_1991 [Actinomycetota bacterium]|nr:hypothetical protein [Actinomycetota bacterium]
MSVQVASICAAATLWAILATAAAVAYFLVPAYWRHIGRENGALGRFPTILLVSLLMAVIAGLGASGGAAGGSYRDWLVWWGWMFGATVTAVVGFVVWLWRGNPEWFRPRLTSQPEAHDMVSRFFDRRRWVTVLLWFASVEGLGYLLAGPRP